MAIKKPNTIFLKIGIGVISQLVTRRLPIWEKQENRKIASLITLHRST